MPISTARCTTLGSEVIMHPNPRVVTFNPVRPRVRYSSLAGVEAFPVNSLGDLKSPMPVSASPMRELAPTTGSINPADMKARRDAFFDFMDVPQSLVDKPSSTFAGFGEKREVQSNLELL